MPLEGITMKRLLPLAAALFLVALAAPAALACYPPDRPTPHPTVTPCHRHCATPTPKVTSTITPTPTIKATPTVAPTPTPSQKPTPTISPTVGHTPPPTGTDSSTPNSSQIWIVAAILAGACFLLMLSAGRNKQ